MKQKSNEDNKRVHSFFNKKTLISLFTVLILLPGLLWVFVTILPLVDKANGDTNGWLGFWGSYLGGVIGTIGVLYVAHLQNIQQVKILEQQIDSQNQVLNTQIQMQKNENDRFIKLEKIDQTIKHTNLYLEKLVNYYENFGKLYVNAGERLSEMQFYKNDKYLVESDFENPDSIAGQMESSYDRLVFKYNELKTLFIGVDMNEEKLVRKLDKDYLRPLECLDINCYKIEYCRSLNDRNIPRILDDYMNDLSLHYTEVVEYIKKLNTEYKTI
ncbi:MULTISPECIES: hypothetical protein [Staphylococcus]|uniref:hypothetical protein n=1 Tax=Staphylococcus TaxID=1279 RepID=UPI0008A2DB60|nr:MULTISPECIES: hypothetical protein [Staphylococcus]OFP27610.1 hypothetical protein HMPREF2994_10840 [Staphylococcus sp. HMSC068H08]